MNTILDWQTIETQRVFMGVTEKPTLVLWAGDINYALDQQHIIWLEARGDGTPLLQYGLLLEKDYSRISLASYDGTNMMMNEVVVGLETGRMIATVRYIWHHCLFTHHPSIIYRWHKVPEQLEMALDFHQRLRGSRRTEEYIYGKSEK